VIGNTDKFLTGEEAEEFDPDYGKHQAVRSLGRGGGKGGAGALTADERSAINQKDVALSPQF
jgi:hypothetical protein